MEEENKKKSNAGRKSSITFEKQEKICKCLRIGSTIEAAAAYADVSKATLYNWLKAGKEKKAQKYVQFLDAVEKAKEYSEIYHLNKIDKHSGEHWQASKWILETRFPRTYGRREVIKLEDNETEDSKSLFKQENLNEIISERLDELEDDRWEDE